MSYQPHPTFRYARRIKHIKPRFYGGERWLRFRGRRVKVRVDPSGRALTVVQAPPDIMQELTQLKKVRVVDGRLAVEKPRAPVTPTASPAQPSPTQTLPPPPQPAPPPATTPEPAPSEPFQAPEPTPEPQPEPVEQQKPQKPVAEVYPAKPPPLTRKEIEATRRAPVPNKGRIPAPYIRWNFVEKRYYPPEPGSVTYMDYPSPDAKKGVLPELYHAFAMNRKYVTEGKDPVSIMLHGPAGTGKSIAVEKFAEMAGLPYYYIPAEPAAMTSEQLLGRKEIESTPEGGYRTVWHDGTIVQAARTGGILHIDEFSLMDPEVTARLHELFDSKRRLSLEGLSGELVRAHPDLFVVISLNPAELGIEGVKRLSSPIRRRFRGIYMDYPPLHHEMEVIKKQLGFKDTELNPPSTTSGVATGKYGKEITQFMRILNDVRAKQSELAYVPTSSEAVDFGRELKTGTDFETAIHRTLLGKYVGDDRLKINESIKAHVPTWRGE